MFVQVIALVGVLVVFSLPFVINKVVIHHPKNITQRMATG